MKAYTLVELLIVMMVFAVIAAMGIVALKNFRDGAQFRSATLEFEKTLDEVRNLARNNVVSRSNTVDPNTDPSTSFNVQIAGYYLDIAALNQVIDPLLPIIPFRLYSCKDGNFDTDSPPIGIDEIRCSTAEDWVLFNRANFRNITIETTCPGIFFRNASSDLYIMDENIISQPISKTVLDPITNTDNCEITLRHSSLTANRVVSYTIDENGNRFFRN